MYNNIYDPYSFKKYNINSKKGKRILNNYLNLVGGASSMVPDLGIACMVFGRFQPPHRSHGELIDLVLHTANKLGGKAFVFTSQSYNDFDNPQKRTKFKRSRSEKTRKKMLENPINIKDKLELLHRLHGHKDNLEIVDMTVANEGKIKSPFNAVPWLLSLGYSKILFFAGTDRIRAYKRLEQIYEGKVEIKELPRPDDGVSGTRVRKVSLHTGLQKFKYIISDKLVSSSLELSEDDLGQIENIMQLYIDIKGRDECYNQIKIILEILHNISKNGKSSDDRININKSLEILNNRKCKGNLNIIIKMVDLIQQGTIL